MASPYRFKAVFDAEDADVDDVRVTLYRREGRICGWYVRPTGFGSMEASDYLPSAEMMAPLAIVRAVAIAEALGVGVCIIDPYYLWFEVWG